jgi:hypothetical protein
VGAEFILKRPDTPGISASTAITGKNGTATGIPVIWKKKGPLRYHFFQGESSENLTPFQSPVFPPNAPYNMH